MIERYTIKFAPAVSLKELEKALHESGETPAHTTLNKFKARIEFVGDFEDVKKVKEFLLTISENRNEQVRGHQGPVREGSNN